MVELLHALLEEKKLFIWFLKSLSLFQYISFTTIGKDPKDPNLVSDVKGEVRQKNDLFKVSIGPKHTQNNEKLKNISTLALSLGLIKTLSR